MALANCLPPLFALPEAKEHLLRPAPVEEVVVIMMGRRPTADGGASISSVVVMFLRREWMERAR